MNFVQRIKLYLNMKKVLDKYGDSSKYVTDNNIGKMHAIYLTFIQKSDLPRILPSTSDVTDWNKEGYKAIRLIQKTGIPFEVANVFLTELYKMYVAGEIDEKYYDPVGYYKKQKVVDKLNPDFFDDLKNKVNKEVIKFGAVAGVTVVGAAAGLYLYLRK